MARSSNAIASCALLLVIGVALVSTCFGSSSSRLTLGWADTTIPLTELQQPAFESTLASILYTATDSDIIGGNLVVPYGSVGLTLPTNWSATPVWQVYNLTTKAVIQELTLLDYYDYMSSAGSSKYFVLARANGLARAYTPNPSAPVYGFIDIFKYNTSSTYAASDRLHSIQLGSFAADRPFYQSAAQSLLAVGISDDQKYVFYNYESGNVTDLAASKYARIGIINLATGAIAAEIDVPESAHPFYEFVITPHGAKFVQVKNGVYTMVFSYYASSLVAGYPTISRNRIMVAQFDSNTNTLTVTDWENLPGQANAFDISNNGKYVAVGTNYFGTSQRFDTLVASNSVDPTSNLRVYRIRADTGVLEYQGATAYEADITHIEYSPNGDRLSITSTLSFGPGGLQATAALALYKVTSSGSAFQLLDSKQIGPIGSTASWADDENIWTIGHPSPRFKNIANWHVV